MATTTINGKQVSFVGNPMGVPCFINLDAEDLRTWEFAEGYGVLVGSMEAYHNLLASEDIRPFALRFRDSIKT